MSKKTFKYALLISIAAMSGLLAGCNDEKKAVQQGQNADQAAADEHNARIARKNEVRRAIK